MSLTSPLHHSTEAPGIVFLPLSGQLTQERERAPLAAQGTRGGAVSVNSRGNFYPL